MQSVFRHLSGINIWFQFLSFENLSLQQGYILYFWSKSTLITLWLTYMTFLRRHIIVVKLCFKKVWVSLFLCEFTTQRLREMKNGTKHAWLRWTDSIIWHFASSLRCSIQAHFLILSTWPPPSSVFAFGSSSSLPPHGLPVHIVRCES